jgi:fumarate hydratase, class II
MESKRYRIEKDSMGDVRVPIDALYSAQTQRAVENFPVSGITLPRSVIRALGLIKAALAGTNGELGLLEGDMTTAIISSALEVADGRYDSQFPLDIFQTGSGTSSNMNCNEVIATLATRRLGEIVHPNDHVNLGQSSNDVIPTAIHVSASLLLHEQLLPALEHLAKTLSDKSRQLQDVIKTGRTHLMDAMPLTMGQEVGGWESQIRNGIARLEDASKRLDMLPQGGTAVGTGINAHPQLAALFTRKLSELTGITFVPKTDFFEGLSTQDAAVEMSGQLKTLAVSLMKISNDLRWMNSGPLAGLGEIVLPALQPGSSIMPGKVNPVIPEAVCMVCAQVIGNDTTITVAGQSGNFQLNVMLPVIAYNLGQSIEILANASRLLADKAIRDFTVNQTQLDVALARNPILVTALNSVIGYELGARIAKEAYARHLPIRDVARELSGLSEGDLDRLLDPAALVKGGIVK